MLSKHNFLYQCQAVLEIPNYRHFCCDSSLHIVCRPEWDLNPGHWISGCNGYTTSICLPQLCLFPEMFNYNIQCTVQCCWYTNNTFLNRSNECASCLCIWPKIKKVNNLCVTWISNMEVRGPLSVNTGHDTPQTCNSISTTVEFAYSMKKKLWCHEQLLYLYM